MALPVVYGRVVPVDGVPYIDGGVADAIPLEAALELAPARIIVVTTRPSGYRKRPSRIGGLLRFNYARFPALWPTFANRWETYNRVIAKLEALEQSGRVQVIRPTGTLPASRMTRDRARILETLSLGESAARHFLAREGLGPLLASAPPARA
jgi:predicted patatin/cPLA2 family phospholipase